MTSSLTRSACAIRAGCLPLAPALCAQKNSICLSLSPLRADFGPACATVFSSAPAASPKSSALPLRPARSRLPARRRSLRAGMADRLLRRIESLGRPISARQNSILRLTPEEKAEADRLLRHRSRKTSSPPAWERKRRSTTGAAALAQLFGELSAAHPGLGLVLLGSADETVTQPRTARKLGPGRASIFAATPRPASAPRCWPRARLFHRPRQRPDASRRRRRHPLCCDLSARCPPGQWFPARRGSLNLYPVHFF